MKIKHEIAFYLGLALACAIGEARADDSLTIHSGPQAVTWTGDLLTLRWGTHQIEFDASTQDNWTDTDRIFSSGLDDDYAFWTIDVMYNHRLMHIPMMCSVQVFSHLGQYDVVAECHA